MRRLIINFNPLERDMETALTRSLNALRKYRKTYDGERITVTWDGNGLMGIYHGNYKDLAIFKLEAVRAANK